MNSKRKTFRLTFTVSIVMLLALAVVLTSVLGNFGGARLDLTEDRVFTMSEAATRILGDLKVPVQVKFYVTPHDKMPTGMRNLERDITDKLLDYERVSGGMLEFSIHNPQDNEDLQVSLQQKGISPFQVQSIDKDEIGVKLIWSALTIAYKEFPEEVIPRVLPQSLNNLEYELISRVFRLVNEEKPTVALFGPAREVDQQVAMMYLQQGMQPPAPQEIFGNVRQLLEQEHYEVLATGLTAESPIPAEADVLLVLNPRDLNQRQAFEINRALSNGMPTVIAVQKHEYNYQPARQGGFSISATGYESGLESVLGSFGVTIGTEHFFDASAEVLDIPRPINMGGIQLQTREPVRAPMHIKVGDTQMNQDAPIASRIASLLYLWGTALELDTGVLGEQSLGATTLLNSSDKCWSGDFTAGPVDVNLLRDQGQNFLGSRPLAVLLEGRFGDSFAGLPVPVWPITASPSPDEAQPPAPPTEPVPLAPQDSKLVVVGCAKMFEDGIIGAHMNALLLLNAVDALAHGNDLISIRSKLLTERTVRPTSDSEKFMYRFLVVGLVPIALAIFGLSRAALRRKEAALYRQSLALHHGRNGRERSMP